MSRRIIDSVVVEALDKNNDLKVKQDVINIFGEATLVEEPKTESFNFDKSQFGLTNFNISNSIKKLKKEFTLNSIDNHFILVDSDMFKHKISSDELTLLKTLTYYRAICNNSLAECISIILNEIDSFYKCGSVKKENDTVFIETENSGDINIISNTNLLNYCREEIYSLFKEVGVIIE
jgi:hypothetical protein